MAHVTERCVVDVTEDGLALREVASGFTVEEVTASCAAELAVGDVAEMTL